MDREQPGAFQKLVGIVIELLLIGALRCHRRALWRSRIVRFRAQLVEARLDPGEAGRQTVERISDHGGNRIDLLTQVLELGVGQIVAFEACLDLLEGCAEFVEHGADRHLIWRRRRGWWRRWRTHGQRR